MQREIRTLLVEGTQLSFNGKTYQIAIGKCGFSQDKREGDHCTPLGTFSLRECWYRADKLEKPQTSLPLRIIQQDDGWCDAPDDENYNRHIKLPYISSHEKLWRDDDMYNLIIPLGYNDAPIIAGKGSAIFMHVARPGYEGTEGCVALEQEDLLEVLKSVDSSSKIIIK